MYDTNFLCTYKLLENSEKSIQDYEGDNDEGDNDEELYKILYQIQLLHAFKIQTFDEKKLVDKQNNIYKIIKDNIDIIKLLDILEKKYINFNKNCLFQILFSYDYFQYFHVCLIDIFNNNKIKEENLKKLINAFNI